MTSSATKSFSDTFCATHQELFENPFRLRGGNVFQSGDFPADELDLVFREMLDHFRARLVAQHDQLLMFKWIATLPSGLEREYVQKAVVWFSGLSDARVETLRAASLLYAVLFSVEGIGLWMRRHWAEWLTVVSTGSLIPLEIWEFTQRPGIGKFSLTAVNVAIVAYLALRLRRERREAAAVRAAAPPQRKVK